MKIEHTPGPWFVTDDHPDRACLRVRSSGEQNIATIYNVSGAWESNARLIAAAPDLLEALTWLLAESDDPIHETDGCTCPPCRARAAIAKAKGD